MSRPARGAWIETRYGMTCEPFEASRPARGAWIETVWRAADAVGRMVAPRAGRVD